MKNLVKALGLKHPWKGKKKKESQATRNRPKSQFSLSPATKAKLRSLAAKTTKGNLSAAVESLVKKS